MANVSLTNNTEENSDSTSSRIAQFKSPEGVVYRAKFIGNCEILESCDKAVCETSMTRLKIEAASKKQHKTKILLVYRWDVFGIHLGDGGKELLYKVPLEEISFVWRDPMDYRAFGIVWKSKVNTKFLAFKTEKLALPCCLVLKELFSLRSEASTEDDKDASVDLASPLKESKNPDTKKGNHQDLLNLFDDSANKESINQSAFSTSLTLLHPTNNISTSNVTSLSPWLPSMDNITNTTVPQASPWLPTNPTEPYTSNWQPQSSNNPLTLNSSSYLPFQNVGIEPVKTASVTPWLPVTMNEVTWNQAPSASNVHNVSNPFLTSEHQVAQSQSPATQSVSFRPDLQPVQNAAQSVDKQKLFSDLVLPEFQYLFTGSEDKNDSKVAGDNFQRTGCIKKTLQEIKKEQINNSSAVIDLDALENKGVENPSKESSIDKKPGNNFKAAPEFFFD